MDCFSWQGPRTLAANNPTLAAGYNDALKSPFENWFTSSYGYSGRINNVDLLACNPLNVANNAQQNRVVTFTGRSPIITGLTSLMDNVTGFCGITQNVIVQRTLLSNISDRLLEYLIPPTGGANVVAITTSMTANTVPNSKLYYAVITPSKVLDVPRISYYNYLDYAIYNNQTIATAAASTPMQSQSLNIAYVPKAIYLWPSLLLQLVIQWRWMLQVVTLLICPLISPINPVNSRQ